MLRIIKLSLLTLVLSTLFSCLKESIPARFTLPAVTMEGLNTFGFEKGSDVFVNYGQVCFLTSGCRPNTSAFYYPSDGQVRVSADKVIKHNGSLQSTETLAIYIQTDHRGVLVYDSQKGDILSIAYDYQRSSDVGGYVLDLAKPNGIVALTKIDTTAGILSGTFSAHLFRRANSGFSVISSDSIVITNGRFDVKYK